MSALDLLFLSVGLYGLGALLSLLLAGHDEKSITISGVLGALGGVVGLIASVPVLLSGHGPIVTYETCFAFADFVIRFDGLGAFMVAVISLMTVATSVYSLSYVREYVGRGAWAMGLYMNLFIASMVCLVVVDNAFWFLVFFEMMSLASYFLVIFDQTEEAVKAGFLYFLIAHGGSILILIAFFILYAQTGNFNFESFRHITDMPLWESSIVFLLAFFGFGAKAGMIPLHGWLPKAHPAAPSHGSAMMSGVMVKIGVFGIVKVGVDLLGAQAEWWGVVVLAFGAVSSVLGVMYALVQHDIKRLLAYHTVENVGIILMGVGVGMIGIATHHPVIAAVGLMAGLYHLLNHAVFKGLLFLGAGSILYRAHTRDMEELGGLARKMPYTALTFLIGAMAISALPPLNGFVSEWYTYQSLFAMSHDGTVILQLAGPIAIVMLAITGALAAMCFIKVYGMSFSGLPRSEHAEHATESPAPMVVSMVFLAVVAILLGLCASSVAPVLVDVAAKLAHVASADVVDTASGALLHTTLIPGNASQAIVSTPMILMLLVVGLIIALIIAEIGKSGRPARRHGGPSWACGYTQEGHMVASPASFAGPLTKNFAPLFRMREQLDPGPLMNAGVARAITAAERAEPFWDAFLVNPVLKFVPWVGRLVQKLQHGDFRIYCLYVVIALVILLLVTAGVC